MPNWVHNEIIFGSKEDLEYVITNYTSTNADGTKALDFNKVIEQPKSLDIPEDTYTIRAKTYLKAQEEGHGDKVLAELGIKEGEASEAWKNALENGCEETVETTGDFLALVNVVAHNIARYGHASWYYWNIGNWGTKWNAAFTRITNTRIYFDTAWNLAEPMITEILQHTKGKVYFRYAEECEIFAGEMVYNGGELVGWERYEAEDDEVCSFCSGFDLGKLTNTDLKELFDRL